MTALLCFSDDVCVLSASGTAALINLNVTASESDVPLPIHHCNTRSTAQVQLQGKEIMTASLDRNDFEKENKPAKIIDKSGDAPVSSGPVYSIPKSRPSADGCSELDYSACSVCHIPYSETSVPFRVNMQKCGVCR